MNNHYVLIDETGATHGEYGHIYREAETNVIPPKGYTIVEDETRTYKHIEVVRSDALLLIPYVTYQHLYTLILNGDDIADQVKAIEERRYERIKKLRAKRELFVTSAIELLEAWQDTDSVEEDFAGMHTNYPFEHSFEEVVAKMQEWGYEE